VVVGGLAVVLRGYARLTADVDLIVDLDEDEALKAIAALTSTGLRPRPPVEATDFAERAIREAWVRERGLRVFSMWDPQDPLREVDLFVEQPIPFVELWHESELLPLGTTQVRVAPIAHLVAMKRLADRPHDRADIAALQAIQARQGGERMRQSSGPPSGASWPDGWDEARRAQLQRIAEATPLQRLQWLKQAIQLAHQTGALPRKRDEWGRVIDR